MSKRNRMADKNSTRNFLIVLAVLMGSIFLCVGAILLGSFWFTVFEGSGGEAERRTQPAPTWAADSAELTVAVSPVMAPVFTQLAEQFNTQGLRTPDGKTMTVNTVVYEPEKMVGEALGYPTFQAMSPDSSLWLDRLETDWTGRSTGQGAAQAEGSGTAAGDESAAGGFAGESAGDLAPVAPGDGSQIPIGGRRVAEQTRYAVSPIVIAAFESAARELGWPDEPIGWQDIQRQATADPNFKWNHPSTNNASGLLATLAEFYAGAGLTRGLTEEAATAQSTLDYVRAVEATVRFYGEGEQVIVARLAEEGRSFLDAFVGQEQVVIDWNQNARGEPLVAIYPAEGTLWTDHPLALLELGSRDDANTPVVTDNQRRTYQALAAFLTGPEAQQQLLAAGYRPADLNVQLDAAGSPFADTAYVDWRQPQTTLQMPSPAVVDVVQNVWAYTKRPTNVFLVADTSGSMEGAKIERAREALAAFIASIRSDRDQVGLVEFGTGLKGYLPLLPMDEANRNVLIATVGELEASGGTALIDATYAAVAELMAADDPQAINAVVVMTDGQENESERTLADLQQLLASTDNPPIIFTIGFGDDADEDVLGVMADIGGGQFRRADETDIAELYQIISTYF
jgi:Ca-activated chloride channel family protein